jgi:hypothetical protein
MYNRQGGFMKVLLKKSLAYYLSLALLLGLVAVPTMVVKADGFKDGLMTFEQNQFGRCQDVPGLAENEVRAEVNGYNFRALTLGDKKDTYFGVYDAALGSETVRSLILDSGEENVSFDKLEISLSNGNRMNFASIEIAAHEVMGDGVNFTITGYKNGVPVEDAVFTTTEEGFNNNYKIVQINVSEMREFKDIDFITISPAPHVNLNKKIIIKSINATEIPSSSNPGTGEPGTGNPADPAWNLLKMQIETYQGGTGTFTADLNMEENTVTVTGNVTGAGEPLGLTIPAGVSVIWKAEMVGTVPNGFSLIELLGPGEFVLAQEGHLVSNGGMATVTMRYDKSSVTVDGGMIHSSSMTGIFGNGNDNKVIVLNGAVSANEGNAISNMGSNSTTWINGGEVSNNSQTKTAIISMGFVKVSRGMVFNNNGPTILTMGSVIIEGYGIVWSRNGIAIETRDFISTVTLDGGIVFSYYNQAEIYDAIKFAGSQNLNITPKGTLVKWDMTSGKTEYALGTSEDIILQSTNKTANWAADGEILGIRVSNAEQSHFFRMPQLGIATLPDDVVVESIKVHSSATKTNYNIGDTLDLSGLIVTLKYTDESIENIPYNEFECYNITVSPVNGSIINAEMKGVEISYDDGTVQKTVNQPITVNTITGYSIVMENSDHGIVSANLTVADPGTEITLSATPDEGYRFVEWSVIEGNISINNNKFIMTDETIIIQGIFELVTSGGSGGNGGSGGTGGSGNNENSGGTTPPSTGTTPTTDVEQITVDVKEGSSDSIASQISIERTTHQNGQKSDKVIYDSSKAIETVNKLISGGKDTARIVIPDEKDEVAETTVTIPVNTMKTLAGGKINLQIDTEEAKIFLSKASISKVSSVLSDELYFHLVPVKDNAEKEAVTANAKVKAAQISSDTNSRVDIIGNPVTIETNMPSAETDIILPLTSVVVPDNTAKRKALLEQIAVYIEHSDGDKELVQGELVEYKQGTYGIRFHINKFSTFTLVKTDAFLKATDKEITKLIAPASAVIRGTNITATVANAVSSITVKADVSYKANYKVYLDKELKKEVKSNKLSLKTGINTSYIKVTAEDKTTKVYKVVITRNKSLKADITKVTIPEKASINGNVITAAVSNDSRILTVKALVSGKATYKLYTDKALKKVIKNNKVNLKVGANKVYIKVTAENGRTTKVYTLTITRKEQTYGTHVRLGVIGSKTYAEKVAKIFEKEYDTSNVSMKPVGKYYLVTMNYKDIAEANKACLDMIRREYIINYYIN